RASARPCWPARTRPSQRPPGSGSRTRRNGSGSTATADRGTPGSGRGFLRLGTPVAARFDVACKVSDVRSPTKEVARMDARTAAEIEAVARSLSDPHLTEAQRQALKDLIGQIANGN